MITLTLWKENISDWSIDIKNREEYNTVEQRFNCSIVQSRETEIKMTRMINDMEVCECSTIHEDVVKAVRNKMPDEEVTMDLADTFKVFSDYTRVKILCALLNHEMCVCDISALLGMTKSAVSHQLRTLKQSNLVKNRREGKVVYYSIADEHVETIISNGMEHVLE